MTKNMICDTCHHILKLHDQTVIDQFCTLYHQDSCYKSTLSMVLDIDTFDRIINKHARMINTQQC